MRRFMPIIALLLGLVAPTSAAAGGCPALPEGVVDKAVYQIGERIEFLDSYTDFADPGTVSIRFERPADGMVLTYTAFNSADGTWFLFLDLDSGTFVGRWEVTVVVDQTSGVQTCTDVVTIRARNAPDTAAASEPSTDPRPDAGGIVVLVALASWSVVRVLRRMAARPH